MHPRYLVLGIFLALALAAAPAVLAAPCACNKICCIGPHNPGVTCETECCTLSGWTTCGEIGTPGCEALSEQVPQAMKTVLPGQASDFERFLASLPARLAAEPARAAAE